MWTADHTCGRREAVDESGEQPEEQPNGARDGERVEETQSFAGRGRGGEVGKKRKKRKTEQTVE